jgi:hypothetical protein
VTGAGTTATFRAGVPLPRGHLAVVEGDATGGALALERAFLALDLAAREGEVQALSGAFAPADTTFLARGLFLGLDPRIGNAALRFDWGARGPGGTVADVARSLGGTSLLIAGADAGFRLPSAAGGPVLCLSGRATAAGVDVEQRSVVEFAAGSELQARPLLGVPVIHSPAPGATVAAGGFSVQFGCPPEATYVQVLLRSDDGTDLRQWQVLAFGTVTRFEFRELPAEAAAILAPGRTWQLTVSAHRVADGPLPQQGNPFNSVIANFASLRPGALGVDAIASATITVSTQ